VLSRRALLRAAAGVLPATVLPVLAGCSDDGAAPGRELVLATGPSGAVFHLIGTRIAGALVERWGGGAVTAVETSASLENLQMLAAGEADLALVHADAAVEATGSGAELTAVGRLYENYLHLFVPEGSPVRDARDLAGLRVGTGGALSGTHVITLRALELLGLDVTALDLDQEGSVTALLDGSADAAFNLSGLPTPAFATPDALAQLRLVPLAGAAELLEHAHPGSYRAATIPVTAYPGLGPCSTTTTPTLLLVRPDLPAAVVEAITETVFGLPRWTSATPTAAGAGEELLAQISVRTGIQTAPVPLHPGATTWFRRRKV
jgi:TRAP transporter TAXI family solute receptor